MTNFSVFVSKLDAQGVHGSQYGCQALDGVAVDHGFVLLHVVAREAIFMDDPAHTAHMLAHRSCTGALVRARKHYI